MQLLRKNIGLFSKVEILYNVCYNNRVDFTEEKTMKKFKSALALLLTFILVAGAVIPVLADEDVEAALLTAVQTEDVSQVYG